MKSIPPPTVTGRARNHYIHGKWKTPEFGIWLRMLDRCRNPNRRAYHRYGGRGITVCDRWHSFAAFLEDMGERPSSKHTLDRIDNEAGYSPENCRWATWKEQQQNRSNNHRLTFQGETLCLSEWAQRVGIKKTTLQERLYRGWSVERALEEPVLPTRRVYQKKCQP
jgi:hypothetical protein